MPATLAQFVASQIADGAVTPAKLADLPGIATALTPHLSFEGGGPHTHPITDVVELETGLADKAPIDHGHVQTDIVGLVADLSGKAAVSHGHIISNVTGLQAALDAKAPAVHGHDASEITNLPAGGGISPCFKAADQTFSSTTLADVADLVFAGLVAGRRYHFRFCIVWRSNTATVGVGLSLAVPAFTVFAARVESIIAADGAAGGSQGAITASNDAVLMTAAPAINTDYIATIEGVLVPSANGSLQVRGRNETGTTPVVIRRGSCGFLTDGGL